MCNCNAKDFALSDVAVHKICRKHGIPTPPLGWWAKKQAGKPVEQTPLSDGGPQISDRIVIAAPMLGSEPSAIAIVREEARLRVSGLTTEADVMPDPIVAQTIAALRKAKPSAKGVIEVSGAGLIRCEVGEASTVFASWAVLVARSLPGGRLEGKRIPAGSSLTLPRWAVSLAGADHAFSYCARSGATTAGCAKIKLARLHRRLFQQIRHPLAADAG